MADLDTKEDELTTLENPEVSVEPKPETTEPSNVPVSESKEAVPPSDSELPHSDPQSEEKKVVSPKSSEKLLTEGGDLNTEEHIKEEIVEEYEEEVINEDGTTSLVKKTRIIKVPSSVSLKPKSVDSFIEKEEEYEEEEIDESGVKQLIKKKRIVQVRREPVLDLVTSYNEIEEEYEEEETDENGQTIIVKKKRIIQVPKVIESVVAKGSELLQSDEKDESSEKEGKDEEGKGSEAEEGVAVVEEVEDEDEFEDVEEEEEEEEEAEELEKVDIIEDTEDAGGEIKRTVSKQKKIEKETDDESLSVVEKVKKRRRRKKKRTLKQKTSKSEIIKEDEEAEEAKSKDEEEDTKSVAISKSSSELRHEEERAAINEQFEILTKIRNEYLYYRKRLFFVNNKIILYLKKQKMEHALTETKDDPDAEIKLANKLTEFYEVNQSHMEEKMRINTEWESQRSVNEELTELANHELDEFMALKREIASKLIDARTGRTIPHDKVIEDLLVRQEYLLKQLSECRLTQIKLKRKIESKKEERKMDHMGADFNLMDYEKLSSLKEYYMDKITERDIEIGEVTQKLNSTEDKLRNVKEQLREKQEEVNLQQQRLQRISSNLNKKRANVNEVKASRHKTEKNTAKMKQQSGLLSYPNLLKDYDEKNEQIAELKQQIETYKNTFRFFKHRIQQLQDMTKKRSTAKFSFVSPLNRA